MGVTEKQLANLRPIKDSERARKLQAKGVKNQVASTKKKRAFKEYLNEWAKGKVDKKDLEVLKKVGIDINDEVTKEALLVIPLINKASKGDMKAWEMIQTYLGNNPKHELELERLREENKKLKLEQERLKAEIGNPTQDKIEVVNDVDN